MADWLKKIGVPVPQGKPDIGGAMDQIGRREGEKAGKAVVEGVTGLFKRGAEAVGDKVKEANLTKAIDKLPETFDPTKSPNLSSFIERSLVALGEKSAPSKDGFLNQQSLDALNHYRTRLPANEPLASFAGVTRDDIKALTDNLRAAAKEGNTQAANAFSTATDSITAGVKELPKPVAAAPAVQAEVTAP